MNVLVINGSPKGAKSNRYRLTTVLPVFMGIFTAWFQKWYPARAAGGMFR